MHHLTRSCFRDRGAGEWGEEHPIGTGVENCQKLCNELPFGKGANHCSCIVVRSNGQCYLRDGVTDRGCNIEQCAVQGPTIGAYLRTKLGTFDNSSVP